LSGTLFWRIPLSLATFFTHRYFHSAS
jgi:hypothetical protein